MSKEINFSFSWKIMLILRWEQTSERAQPEGAGSHGNSNLRKTVVSGRCTQAVARVLSGLGQPQAQLGQALAEEVGTFSLSPQKSSSRPEGAKNERADN